jgi:hypothetical protein
MIKLSAAQARTYTQIIEAQPSTPNRVHHSAWLQVEDFVSRYTRNDGTPSIIVWPGNRVYGAFNTATLRSLEKKGLILVHRYGGSWMVDEIEVLERP